MTKCLNWHWLCLGIWITPFLSCPVCPKTVSEGTASTAGSAKRVTAPPALGRAVCVTMVHRLKFCSFHYGSEVNWAAESHPVPPPSQGCTKLCKWSFLMPQGFIRVLPSFKDTPHSWDLIIGLAGLMVPLEHLAADDLFCHLSPETAWPEQDMWALKETTGSSGGASYPCIVRPSKC